MYQNYNDYELLYLIRDGNPNALNMMFRKYDTLIKKEAYELLEDNNKVFDLIQEGRMLLYDCINKYDDRYDISFYSYFLICLRRKFKREIKREYYYDYYELRENAFFDTDLSEKIALRAYRRQFKDDELAMVILEEHIIRDISIAEIAKEYDIPYKKVMNKKKEIIEAIKKIID